MPRGHTSPSNPGPALALLALALGSSACAGHRPPPRGAAPAIFAAGPLPSGPAEPVRGLPIPSLDVGWMPPILTAGDLGSLRDALQRHPSVALVLGDRLGGDEWESRAGALVRTLRPQATVTTSASGADPFAGVTLPSPVSDAAVAAPPAGSLPTAPDASATLLVGDVGAGQSGWRSLPARAVGSCRAPMEALAAGQEQSLAELEPFLDHADAVLWQVYRATMQATLPRLRAELSAYRAPRPREAFDDEASFAQHRCGHAYWEVLRAFEPCGAQPEACAPAPRLFLVGGARIGTAEPSVYVPSDCAAKVGRDYVAELRSVATESAEVAQEYLAPSWSALADRLGSVTEVYQALEDVCVPQRRRFAEDDLEVVRGRLAAIGRTLASDELGHPAGRWVTELQPFHVPGFGPVQQVAYYDAGPGSPSEAAVGEARALRELVLQRALCRSAQPSMPMVAALVEGTSGEVESFGYFFEEQLFCGELPPLLPPEATKSAGPAGAKARARR